MGGASKPLNFCLRLTGPKLIQLNFEKDVD